MGPISDTLPHATVAGREWAFPIVALVLPSGHWRYASKITRVFGRPMRQCRFTDVISTRFFFPFIWISEDEGLVGLPLRKYLVSDEPFSLKIKLHPLSLDSIS
jgi:hypothetical protein